jgi:hypothetical protein
MTRLGSILCLVVAGCDLAYPEVVVTNQTSETVQLRDVGYNGCSWEGVLAFGESTSPGHCLPGEDRVHFQKFDAAAYCREQAEDGAIDGLCPCDGGTAVAEIMEGLTNAEPMWFNYQTVGSKSADYGEFRRFEITLSGLEQDFSVPGPYPH